MVKFKSDKFDEAQKAFDAAVARSRLDTQTASGPMVGLFVAINKYNVALVDYMMGIEEHLDEIERKINIIDARVQGKSGPFDLKMR